MTRTEIENLQVGDFLQFRLDAKSEFCIPRQIVSITHKGEDIHGKLFACFYTTFGEKARISGSIKEGEPYYRIAQ